jgi:mono/diheme cytochrome c family protein
MRHRLLASFVGVWTIAVWFAALASTSATAQSGLSTAAAPSGTATPASDLVAGYCVSCHNGRLKTGNLTLDNADARQVANAAETWEKVIVKLRGRTMPPPGSRRPDSATYERAAAWLEGALDAEAAAHPNPGRPGGLHRLNRTEYANAVRDLLGVEIDAKAMLPPDQQAYGFDTNADALSMEP